MANDKNKSSNKKDDSSNLSAIKNLNPSSKKEITEKDTFNAM